MELLKIINEYFEKMIHGKRVALVGPAKYMMSSGLGEEIDKHDVVIRINRSIETTKQYPDDVGTKCDVLYSCLIETAQNAGKIIPSQLKNDYGVKFVVAPPESQYNGVSHHTELHPMVNGQTAQELMKTIPLRIVSHGFHTELAKKVQCRPNTGFLAIYDLLNFNPSTLSIYGFSFYLDGFIPGCKSGVEKEKNVTEDEFATMAFNSKRHVQKNMWQYAKDTLRNNPSVKLDSVLEVILNLEKLDKKLFSDAIK
tara:strand:- start:1060 stop:1821 length:762 start_codon:yes stop_codon:yes gene_type:complete